IEEDFVGVVDVLSQKAYVWDESGQPENYEVQDIPADMVDKAAEYREMLIETALEQDEDLMMAYLEEGEEPSLEDIQRCIRKGTRDLAFFPTYCGSAYKNKGIQLILDAVVDYLPAPTEVDPQPLTDSET
ncbi:elongation factor G, partial [Klebsiella pneumoniae]